MVPCVALKGNHHPLTLSEAGGGVASLLFDDTLR